jgi:outer membrane protein OmpA-like peptidoglycan-associated protein
MTTQRKIVILIAAFMLTACFSFQSYGQFQSKGVRVGIGGGFLRGETEKVDDKFSEALRGFIRYNIKEYLDGDLAASYGGIKATDYQADLWLVEYKFLIKPYAFNKWEPYLGAGVGLGYYFSNATFRAPSIKQSAYMGYIPLALGVEYALTDVLQIDINGSINYSFTDNIVTNRFTDSDGGGLNDAWWGIFASVSYTVFGGDNDADKDGLLKSVEKQLGTNPNKADTDGDGLSDGDEVNKYHTNPLKVDSDNDNLPDKDEIIVYKTNPNKTDTDGDGLSDGDEVLKYNTNPLKTDTDGDGLSDGDEVLKYKTDPLKVDTDGDGLSDGDEVLKHKTDPLKADTDGDGISDGDEVLKFKTNPLDPKDPPKEVAKPVETPKAVALNAEVGKAIVLEGVVFKVGSSTVGASSDSILARALKTFLDNPTMEVEIRGYTDNTGDAKKNVKLSQTRADAVKTWMMKRGVPANRISSKGYGSADPIATNTTEEGRAQNRRIEFIRIK